MLRFSFPLCWDHPRPCGEKLLKGIEPVMRRGSPPPMRGKVAAVALILTAIRITPAHAGKSVCFI